MPLSDDDVREILRIIDESDLSELRLDTEGFSLHVVKGKRRLDAPEVAATGARGEEPKPAAPARSEEPKPAAEPEPTPSDGAVTIPAPMLGTFYRAEAPGKPPFVEVGSQVEPDTIVCIIEVMKMMNSVSAGVSGRVTEVIAENAQLVEYGEPLFRVEPA
jgi:acetyl-CoA carboxylase biotin carboxyl carrier protein